MTSPTDLAAGPAAGPGNTDAPGETRRGPRVLMVDGALRENGGVRVMLDLAARWNHAGTPTTVFALQQITDHGRLLGRTPIVYGQRRPGRLRWGLPLAVLRFLGAARKADLILSMSEEGVAVLVAAFGAAVLRRPLVIAVHAPMAESIRDWVPRPLRRLNHFVDRHAAAAVCVSRGIAEDAIACRVPAARVAVVTNGVDSAAIRARAAAPPEDELEAPLVVAVGRLAVQKGFDVLIRAHATARNRTPHQLVIVGEGAERTALEALATELGVADSVSLLGFRDNPHAIMRRADLLCLSSRYEGHPLILIEALAVGVPIVATDCVSGPSEILAEGAFGDLVPTGSVDALATAISRHLADPDRLRAIARLGPARAAEFDPDACAARWVEIFRAVLAARSVQQA